MARVKEKSVEGYYIAFLIDNWIHLYCSTVAFQLWDNMTTSWWRFPQLDHVRWHVKEVSLRWEYERGPVSGTPPGYSCVQKFGCWVIFQQLGFARRCTVVSLKSKILNTQFFRGLNSQAESPAWLWLTPETSFFTAWKTDGVRELTLKFSMKNVLQLHQPLFCLFI